ncbi:hypothetical protein C8R45DRAFT_941965 [Mycena sanguinolenta]|nr:hypothetical protein C8R45DRAFT_941965 [Mycena sanguinolenta]
MCFQRRRLGKTPSKDERCQRQPCCFTDVGVGQDRRVGIASLGGSRDDDELVFVGKLKLVKGVSDSISAGGAVGWAVARNDDRHSRELWVEKISCLVKGAYGICRATRTRFGHDLLDIFVEMVKKDGFGSPAVGNWVVRPRPTEEVLEGAVAVQFFIDGGGAEGIVFGDGTFWVAFRKCRAVGDLQQCCGLKEVFCIWGGGHRRVYGLRVNVSSDGYQQVSTASSTTGSLFGVRVGDFRMWAMVEGGHKLTSGFITGFKALATPAIGRPRGRARANNRNF